MHDKDVFERPGKFMTIILHSGGSAYGIYVVSQRRPKGDSRPDKILLTRESIKDPKVRTAMMETEVRSWQVLAQMVASHINRVAKGRSLFELWAQEEVEAASQEIEAAPVPKLERPISNIPRYTDKSRILFFTGRGGTRFNIEMFDPRHSALSEEEVDRVVNDMRIITRLSWGEWGETVQKWFNLADLFLMARRADTHEMVGFATGRLVPEERLVILPSTMVIPGVQGEGLATFLNTAILKTGRNTVLRNTPSWKFWKELYSIYYAYRTRNPRAFGLAARRTDVVPSPRGRRPTHREISIAARVANMLSPNCVFNPETFIINLALADERQLLESETQWYGDPLIDDFCDRYLHLKDPLGKLEGNLFVVVGHFNFWHELKEAVREKIRRFLGRSRRH